MPQNFWQSYRPVVIDLSKSFVKTIPITSKLSPIYTTLTLPVFSIGIIPWMGSSFITVEFPVVGLGVPVSFVKPITPPAGVTFCLAIRWIRNGQVIRYKFWSDIGEKLLYPVYNCEAAPAAGFVLEVWSLQFNPTTELLVPYSLKTSILTNVSLDSCACNCYIAPNNIGAVIKTALFTDNFPEPMPQDFNTDLQGHLGDQQENIIGDDNSQLVGDDGSILIGD